MEVTQDLENHIDSHIPLTTREGHIQEVQEIHTGALKNIQGINQVRGVLENLDMMEVQGMTETTNNKIGFQLHHVLFLKI